MTEQNDRLLLANIKVLELATMVMAPSACVVLADFGAEVIKVEPPGKGDLNRDWHKIPGMPVSDFPYQFQIDNRNKKSIALDLKSEQGYAAVCKLIAQCDVLVTNHRLRALDNLKLRYSDVQKINPKIIYALATGWGEHGDEKHKPGYDSVCYWTRSAIETTVFPFEGWLRPFPFGSGDHPSGMTLFAAIMTALYRRTKTGKGCKVSTSLLANGAWSNSVLLQAQLCGAQFREVRHRDQAFNFTSLHYPTSDKRLLKLSIVNFAKDWVPLCAALGRSDIVTDPRFSTAEARTENMPSLIAELTNAFAMRELAHWLQQLEQADVPHAAVPTFEEAANDRQKAANNIVIPMQHPKLGESRTINSPFEIEGADKVPPGPAPELGQHSVKILEAVGYSNSDIDHMLGAGVVEQFQH